MLTVGLELAIGALRSTPGAPAGGPVELVVERDLDVPVDAARIRLADAGDVAAGDPVTVGLGSAGLGSAGLGSVGLGSAGLGAAGGVRTVFTGTVAEIRAGIAADSLDAHPRAAAGRTTEVIALGSLLALVDLRVAAIYEDRTLGAVARDLVSRAGLSPGEIDEGPTLPRLAVDLRLGAYEHLRKAAVRFGLQVWAGADGRVHLGAPGGSAAGGLLGAAGVGGVLGGAVAGAAGTAAAGTAGPAMYGGNVLAGLGGRRRAPWDVVDVAGESPASTQGRTAASWLTTDEQAARASAGSGSRTRLVLDPVVRTRDLASDSAAGRLSAQRRRGHEVVVTLSGGVDADLGDPLAVTGPSDPLLAVSGHVQALRHHLAPETGLTTTVRIATEPGP